MQAWDSNAQGQVMTDAKSGSQASGEAGQLMNKVLQAEREAKLAVAECEQRAQDILKAARARAQRLVSRADESVTGIQMRCNHRIDSMVKAMEKQQQAPDGAAQPGQLGERAIKAVVAALAAELTGSGDETADERQARE